MKNISLENFNPKSSKEPIITSPRSLEACRRQGILPSELIMRSIDEIKHQYGDSKLDRAGLELVAQHFEERREEKIRVLLEERAQIIEEEKDGLISFSSGQEAKGKSMMSSSQGRSTYQNALASKGDSTLIEREKRQLERIKQRQEKEIKQMVEYEAKMAEIQRVQEEKLKAEQERQRQREIELSLRRKEAEEEKLRKEQEKRMKAEQEEEMRRALAAEEYRKEQERAELEKLREKERRLEAKRKEEEQKQKHEEFVKMTEEKLLEQQLLIEQKKQIMEEKDKIRQEHLKEQQLLQKQEAIEKRKQLEEKLKHAKHKNDEILEQKKLEFELRQQKNEEKRKQFERELQYKKEESRWKAEKKTQTIKKVLEENQKLEEKRREEYYSKKMTAEERKKELEMIAEHERKLKIQEEKEREMKRHYVKQNMEKKLEERVHGYLSKIEESNEKVQKVQTEKEEYLKNKHALDIIKRADKQENVQRIARMQEYQREKLMEKIKEDTERAEHIKQERNELLDMRMGIRRDMEKNKRSLVEKFDQVKRGRVTAGDVSTEFTRSVSLMNSQQARFQDKSQKSVEEPQTSFSASKKTPANLERKRLEPLNIKKTSPKNSQDEKKNVQAEAKKLLESLKSRQNHEMLAVLEEEQNKENAREAKLQATTNPKEREKMEKTFSMERAKAHARIQQLADSHDEAIRQMMAKFNLKNS